MNYYPSYSSQQKQQANIDQSGQGFQLPKQIHYHSRQNSSTDFSNLLVQNNKGTNSDINNNLCEYTNSNYNPQQNSPFTNLTQLDYKNYDQSGNRINLINSQIPYKQIDSLNVLPQYEYKSSSDKNIQGGQFSNQIKNFKPNEINTDNQLDQKSVIYPTFQEGDGVGLNIIPQSISINSVNPTASINKYSSDVKDNKNIYKLQDERKILQFDDSSSKLSNQINQTQYPIIPQNNILNLNTNISQLKIHQSDFTSSKNRSNSVEKSSNPILMHKFEYTPDIINGSKNILLPKFPDLYNQVSLNNPAQSKIKKNSPKNNANCEITFKIGDILNNQSVPQQQQIKSNNLISQFQLQENEVDQNSHKICKILKNNDIINDKYYLTKPNNENYYSKYNSNLDILKQKQPQDIPSLQHILNNPSSHTLQVPSSIQTQKLNNNIRSRNNLSQNKYSSNYKPKSITNNPLDDSKHARDNSISGMQEQISILKDMYKIDLKNSPEKHQNNSYYQSNNNTNQSYNNISSTNKNVIQQDYQKMMEFPQKKREILEQQRILMKQERNILQKEKELIDKEEEIFYITSQGRLNSNSPERLSNNPFNNNQKSHEQKRQNYYVNGNYQQDNSGYTSTQVNPLQYRNSFSRSKRSIQQSIETATLDNSYDKKIRESQSINPEYKQKYISSIPYQQYRNNSVEQIKQNNYPLNTVYCTKDTSLFQNSVNSNKDYTSKAIKEQHFQKNDIDIEQSFQRSLDGEDEKKLKDIIKYFKSEQDSQKKLDQNYNQIELSTQTQTPQELSNQKSKVIQLPLSMKKEISFQNKQPQIQTQSPEKTQETIIFDSLTPQKEHINKRELNSQLPAQNNEISVNDISNNNLNKYLVKKKQIFSPITNRTPTPTRNSHINNQKYDNYKADPNKQENGVQVDENSFNEGRPSQNRKTDKTSPSGRQNYQSGQLNSLQKSIGYPKADRNSIKYGFSNACSPIMAIPQNDISTNDIVESQIPSNNFISNNQSILKPEQQDQNKSFARSSSNPHNNQRASIEYANPNTRQSQNRKEKREFLCFDCGNSQISSENNVIIDSQQDNQLQTQHNQPPEYQFNQPTQRMQNQTQQQTQNHIPQQIQNDNIQPHNPQQNEHQVHLQTFQNQIQDNQLQNSYNAPQIIKTNPINQNTQEDQKNTQILYTITTQRQDSIKSPCFRDERDDPVKQSRKSPQRIFQTNTRSNNNNNIPLKTDIQTNIEKVSYNPNDYKNSSNVQNVGLSQNPLCSSFYPNNNNQNKSFNNNTNNTPNHEGRPPIKSQHNPSNANNSFQMPKYPHNNQSDLTLDQGQNGNIQGILNMQSQEKYCEKCLEFVSLQRYDTHASVCNEMKLFTMLDHKKQLDIINQKIKKIAYVVKRKSTNISSPIKGSQQNSIINQLVNSNQQQQIQQNNDNKLITYCNYLNECLSEISNKNISQSDICSAKDDLKLIIQRLKSVRDNSNIYYYGERALDLVNIKENIMIQNPI